MFEPFVIGPIAGGHLGIVRQCIDCRAVAAPDSPQCQGFGPGCLTTPRAPVKAFESRVAPGRRREAP
ncbi:MAG: hypothetical protein ACXWHB_01120 [Usitatibacter sp.]